jgi:hypothetical protein
VLFNSRRSGVMFEASHVSNERIELISQVTIFLASRILSIYIYCGVNVDRLWCGVVRCSPRYSQPL